MFCKNKQKSENETKSTGEAPTYQAKKTDKSLNR